MTEAESVKERYVYDVRGSVIQTITGKATEHIAEITGSYAYTPYGEQLGDAYSGYGYNGEHYDAATGMLNLRARQYEPGMMRFAQPDVVRGYALDPQTVNRYAYGINNPVVYGDPSGQTIKQLLGGLAGAITGAKAGGETAYTTTATGSSTIQKAVAAVKGTIAGAKAGYTGGYKAAQTKNGISTAITAGLAAGAMYGSIAGFDAAIALEQKWNTMTALKWRTRWREILTQQQLSLKQAQNAEGIEIGLLGTSELCAMTSGTSYTSGLVEADSITAIYAARYYNFDPVTIKLLDRTKSEIEDRFGVWPIGTQRLADEEYLLAIGRLIYGNGDSGKDIYKAYKEVLEWNGTADRTRLPLLNGMNHRDYFTEVLNFTPQEANYLYYSIELQHRVSGEPKKYPMISVADYDADKSRYEPDKLAMEGVLGRTLSAEEFVQRRNDLVNRYKNSPDYAHFCITLAANLTGNHGALRVLANMATGGDEQRKDMAGWLGDATIKNSRGKVVFENDDYMADLDAENIAYIMASQQLSVEEAQIEYDARLAGGKETRATIFLSHTSLEEVERAILQGLRISSREELRKQQPGAYNFIRSLEIGLNTMGDFANE